MTETIHNKLINIIIIFKTKDKNLTIFFILDHCLSVETIPKTDKTKHIVHPK